MLNSRLAIIPARGGSKRLPRKNILTFRGLPLLAHSIRTAQDCGLFARIVVSTEDAEIGAIAQEHGAQVVWRPAHLATDTATLEAAALHTLDALETEGATFDLLCLLMPNCPLRLPSDLCASLWQLEAEGADYLMSVVDYGWLKPYWALEETPAGLHRYFDTAVGWANGEAPRALVCPSGAIRWARVEAFRRDRTFYGPGLRGYRLPWERSADIDDADDLARAEILARLLEI
ncbi:MAG TPA: acylneuraminate cytidylyltransferase family protein [Chthonomonadaceae bacterium]|nr:acylneuraminate cytidylyltransferase family protein [Chthonomonadaceae bacterium]